MDSLSIIERATGNVLSSFILTGLSLLFLSCERQRLLACDGSVVSEDLSSPLVNSRLAQTERETMPVLACLVKFDQLPTEQKLTCINSVRDKGMEKMKDDIHYTVQHTPASDKGCFALTTLDDLLAKTIKISQQ